MFKRIDLGLALLLAVFTACAARADEPPVRLLFAGSSSTYQHDMPGQVATWLSQLDERDYRATIAGRSGDGIHVYLRPGFDRYQYGVPQGKTFLDVVAAEKADWVVLQVVCRFIHGEQGKEHAAAVDQYCEAIRAAGGEPMIYEMGWGRGEAEAEGRELIFQSAVKNRVTKLVPCSTAWARVRQERPDLELQNLPDTVHPGTLGTYLNLCCFAAAVLDQAPGEGAPRTVRTWQRFEDRDAKQRAEQALSSREVKDPYVSALPSWMQTNYLLATDVEIDPEVARYLRRVAWECWQETRDRLKAAMAQSQAAEPTGQATAALDQHFRNKIEPILKARCYECHSHESGEASSGLVLDSRAGWESGGSLGAAIVPGKPDESPLVAAIQYEDPFFEMPPDGKMPAEEIATLVAWISAGAHDPRGGGKAPVKSGFDFEAGRQWWSFQPIQDPAVPAVNQKDWPTNAIDHFLLTRLESEGLAPAVDAEPDVLLRRLSYDLTGLPPTSEQLADFRRSAAIDLQAAIEHVVDEMLASPQYGEKWGRHWLDLARYADSNGSSCNTPYHDAWRYRNWVIQSVTEDRPWDRFVTQQIAGDLLPWSEQHERDENLIATGYLMLGSKVLGLFDKEQLTLDVVDEQIDTIGKSLLGMTVSCARCHDHKFDPIPQRDYYALAGIFTSTVTLDNRLGGPKEDESDWSRRGLGPDGDQQLQAFLAENRYPWVKLTQRVYQQRKQIRQIGDSDPEKLAEAQAKLDEHLKELAELEKGLPPIALAVRDAQEPKDTALRIRGVPSAHGDLVPRGFLKAASSGTSQVVHPEASGRAELAAWITSPDNPLTTRVYVNRIWKHIFRHGLVRSVDNFGHRGELPSHPELLDYLAKRFVEGGWRTKPLVRLLVTSRAYRMATTHDARAASIDPENRLLWRQNRRRLEAEEIRDSLLLFANRLDLTAGQGMLGELPIADISNVPNLGNLCDDRRTVYQPVMRTQEPDVLQIFDGADSAVITGARSRTVVAPQALYFLNSPLVQECADLVARQTAELGQADPQQIVGTVVREIWRREPTPREFELLTRYLEHQSDDAHGVTRHDIAKLCQAVMASTQFQFLD